MCSCKEPKRTDQEVTRRELLAGVLASGVAVALAGCGGGSLFETGGGGGGGLTRRPQTLTLNFDTNPVAVESGRSINYVASYTGNGLQSAFWGSQQTTGVVNDIAEALVWDTNADQGVRVTFDGRGLPSKVVNEANGAFVTCFWDPDRSTFKFYQPSGAYIGGCTVTGAAPNFALQQLADSVVAGLFTGNLQGATDGIFSITVGGTATTQAKLKRDAKRNPEGRAAGRADQLVPGLTRLTQVTSENDYPAPAKALIDALSSEYLSTGKSDLFARITATALNNTGMVGLYLDNGLSIVRGILSAPVLQQAATDMLSKVNAGQDLVGQQVIRYNSSSPGLTGYVSPTLLAAPAAASDGTAVSGIMVSRDFGSIPVTGVIDSSGNFTATGTANGTIVTMTGTVSGQTVTGNWTSSQSARSATRAPGGGSFNGNQQPLGQCQTQQNSGGQGTFTNTYDLKTCGKFELTYDMFTIPDAMTVLNDGKTIFDTGGPVSGGQTVELYVSGASTLVTVVVIASLQGTAWVYTIGCPS